MNKVCRFVGRQGATETNVQTFDPVGPLGARIRGGEIVRYLTTSKTIDLELRKEYGFCMYDETMQM